MSDIPQSCKIVIIIGGVVFGLIFILICSSFGYLDYYEYGFKKQKSTSRVFTDYLYGGGRYFIGPDFDFKTYPASASDLVLNGMSVTSKDTLEVNLDVQFQYFIRPSQLSILHKKYQLTYDAVIRSSAMDALKAAAVNYTTEQFIKDRNVVEQAMSNSVRLRVGGKCCEMDCDKDICFTGCIPLDKCTKEADMGLMVTMRHFFLTKVRMPYKVYNRYLKALLLVEESQMEKYRLEEAVVKKEVDEVVKGILNQAREVSQNSSAEAGLITRKADAEALKTVGSSRSEGLSLLMQECDVSGEKEKLSLHYLSSLSSNDKAHLAVDFENYVIGGK